MTTMGGDGGGVSMRPCTCLGSATVNSNLAMVADCGAGCGFLIRIHDGPISCRFRMNRSSAVVLLFVCFNFEVVRSNE